MPSIRKGNRRANMKREPIRRDWEWGASARFRRIIAAQRDTSRPLFGVLDHDRPK